MKSKQVLAAIRKSVGDRAVFLMNGDWKTISADGPKLDHMLNTHMNECMGVYTPDCPEIYIENDIYFMERKFQ